MSSGWTTFDCHWKSMESLIWMLYRPQYAYVSLNNVRRELLSSFTIDSYDRVRGRNKTQWWLLSVHLRFFIWNIAHNFIRHYFALHLQLLVQSVPIITNVVSLNPAHGEVYLIQHCAIKFVSQLRQVDGFLLVLRFPLPIKLTAMMLMEKVCHKPPFKWNCYSL